MRTRFVVCAAIAVATVVFACFSGSAGLSITEFWKIVVDPSDAHDVYRTILFDIRLPRIAVGALCGLALASAGVLSQGMFRNALASPSIIGTTAGGSTAAAFVFYFGVNTWHWFTLPLAAFAGACCATLLIYCIASYRRFFVVEHLLLAGFALNAFLGSLTSLVISLVLEDHEKFPSAMYWLMGGLNAKSWSHVGLAAVPVFFGLWTAVGLCRQLDVLALGEEIATSLSIDTARLRRHCILTIALLVGISISVAGAITFVGLIVPHISRMIVGPKHRYLLGVSAANGVTLVVLADTAARTLRAPYELQVGVLIAMLGAPFFFWLLFQRTSPSKVS